MASSTMVMFLVLSPLFLFLSCLPLRLPPHFPSVGRCVLAWRYQMPPVLSPGMNPLRPWETNWTASSCKGLLQFHGVQLTIVWSIHQSLFLESLLHITVWVKWFPGSDVPCPGTMNILQICVCIYIDISCIMVALQSTDFSKQQSVLPWIPVNRNTSESYDWWI